MAKKRGRPRKVTDGVVENIELSELEETKEVTDSTESIDDIAKQNTPEPNVEKTVVQDDSSIVGEGTFADFNPLMENVVERDYSTPKVASGVVEDITEPSFIPPSYEDIVAEKDGEQLDDEQPFSDNPFDNPNPALNDLDNKDKKIACESLVDTCLDAYEQLHKYAQYVVKVDEESLMEKQAQGKIDLQEVIPVTENGDTMTVGEFIGQFNEQSVDALKYDKEFGYKVRPAMIRVFMKKGWGMSDEQFLMYMFGKDLAIKVGIMYQLKKSINSTISTLEKAHKRKGSSDYTQVYEEKTESTIIEDEPILEDDPIMDEEIEEAIPEPIIEEDNFTSNMNINMPQNPKDPMAEHPKEIRTQIKKAGRPRKPKTSDE